MLWYRVNVEAIYRVLRYRVNVEAIYRGYRYRVNVEAIYRGYRYRVNLSMCGGTGVEVIEVTMQVGLLKCSIVVIDTLKQVRLATTTIPH